VVWNLGRPGHSLAWGDTCSAKDPEHVKRPCRATNGRRVTRVGDRTRIKFVDGQVKTGDRARDAWAKREMPVIITMECIGLLAARSGYIGRGS
jgi:hypothetical protein